MFDDDEVMSRTHIERGSFPKLTIPAVDCIAWRRGCRSSQAFWCGLPCPRPDAISRARSVPILLKLNSNTAKRSRPE